MQREIKFRAWNSADKTMGEPFTLQTAIGSRLHNGVDTNGVEYMQFTGLKDKNGMEIYEGDIVECERLSHQPAAKSEWRKFKAPIVCTGHKFMFRVGKGTYMDIYPAEAMEMVGNIYETPSLGL